MDRLTRTETIMVGGREEAACNYKNDDCNDSCMYGRCRWQEKANMLLKEYEDIGLTPEQIEELKERDNGVTECCPHCDREITVSWNVEQDGYQIFCPNCGETIMLCSMCNREPCDWTEKGCKYSDERYGKRKEQK